jgi:hypothetical protein
MKDQKMNIEFLFTAGAVLLSADVGLRHTAGYFRGNWRLLLMHIVIYPAAS